MSTFVRRTSAVSTAAAIWTKLKRLLAASGSAGGPGAGEWFVIITLETVRPFGSEKSTYTFTLPRRAGTALTELYRSALQHERCPEELKTLVRGGGSMIVFYSIEPNQLSKGEYAVFIATEVLNGCTATKGHSFDTLTIRTATREAVYQADLGRRGLPPTAAILSYSIRPNRVDTAA
ncbi:MULTISPECIES: hypothetical protein [Actinomadura]|uniref:hypothetical protein n=1 Tax=unclassified Actinomadura TaxID=2626254 RepID=UPI00339492DF